MIGDLKPYPAMKHSGVPWLGEVPEHWERVRLKATLRAVDRRSSTGTETLLSLRRDHGVVAYSDHFSRPAQAATTIGYKLVTAGQLVVNRLQANNGLVFESGLDGLVSPDYSVFESRGLVLMRYLSDVLRTATYRSHFRRESTGLGTGSAGFLRLYDDRFLESPVALPPLLEQAAIIRFVDYADRRIGRYIRAKQRLIKLLEEQKQTIIHRAITRGLDPEVRVRPSGVEWVGNVPEHWEIVPLKRVLRQIVDCEHKTAPAVDDSEFRVVRTSAVRHGLIRWEGTYCTSEEAYKNWTQRATPEPGDVIFTREAPAGEACVVPDGRAVCLGQRTVLMKLRQDRYDPQFLVHMIYAGPPRERIRLASQGSTVGHFNMDDIGWMHVLAPTIAEQRTILDEVRQHTHHLDEGCVRAAREITLLREYRTHLTADVVTGKLDVREAAARVPDDDIEEPEPLDETDMPFDAEDATAYDLDTTSEVTKV